MPTTVLITGATGQQGGAVVDNLLQAKAEFTILAVTRNTTSPSAQRLAKKSPNIKLVQGDLDNPEGIFENAKTAVSGPIWGVYSVQTSMGNGQTGENEIKQGKALIDASIKNSVKHFIYSSVDRGGDKSFDNPTPVPFFTTKYHIEHHLVEKTLSGNMDWTILRPTGFLNNYVPGFLGKIFFTHWKMMVKKPLQNVAVSDIGWFAAQAFMKPEQYKGKGVSIVGDESTFDEAARVFKQKTGKDIPLTFPFLAWLVLFFVKDIATMYKWLEDDGFGADIHEIKKINPGLVDFGTYLESQSGFATNV